MVLLSAGGVREEVFQAVPHAPRGALGGFLSAGKVFQPRVMFDGFVRPGMATALGHQHVTLPSPWPRAVGLGSQLWGWECWSVPGQPSQSHSGSPSLGLPLWQKGMFFLLFSMQRKLPQADLGQERLQLTWPVQAGLGNPGKVLVGVMVPVSPLQEPSRIEEEPEGQSCCSHLGWMDRQTSSLNVCLLQKKRELGRFYRLRGHFYPFRSHRKVALNPEMQPTSCDLPTAFEEGVVWS